MTNHLARNIFIGLVGVAVVGGFAVLFGAFSPDRVASDINEPLSPDDMAALIPKGRELAMAGDCMGCHSLPEGPMAAGGVPIPTPFGTIYSANITPSNSDGIGAYSRADFHRALREGVGRNGNLYPAMPYIYTQITTPGDADALYAYFMSIPPIDLQPPANTGVFVLPVRPFMNFWNLLNFPEHSETIDAARSAAWNRGAYLVEGLGHCGACHTPANIMMGSQFDRPLQGGLIDGFDVPPITPSALTARGYDLETLMQYLGTGYAPQGTSYAGMYTVTHFSTSQLKPDDVNAIATYLLTGPDGTIAPPAQPPAPVGTSTGSGSLTYAATCAGCHGAQGEGIPHVAPAMKGNSTLAFAEPRNLIRVVLEGIPTQTFTGNERMYTMPGFADRLNDAEIAELATWMRAEWGGQPEPTTTDEVEALRP